MNSPAIGSCKVVGTLRVPLQGQRRHTECACYYHSQGFCDVPQDVHHHTFPNGLTLLAERMEHVRSAALNFLVPAGCVYDPPKTPGLASVLSEMITRGAGNRNSRELTLALNNLGLDRDESVGSLH